MDLATAGNEAKAGFSNGRGEADNQVQYIYLPLSAAQMESEVGLADYWGAVRRRKFSVALLTLLFGAAAGIFVLHVEPAYVATISLMTPDDATLNIDSAPGGPGGNASIRVTTGGSGKQEEALAILGSRDFTARFIREENLLPILFTKSPPPEESGNLPAILPTRIKKALVDAKNAALKALPAELSSLWAEVEAFAGVSAPESASPAPTIADGVVLFSTLRTIEMQGDAGMTTVSIRWGDPVLAAHWANQLIARLNRELKGRDVAIAQKQLDYLNAELEKTRLLELQQAYHELIKQQVMVLSGINARNEYAFRIIDPAVPPPEPVWTTVKSVALIAVAVVTGMFVGILIAILRGRLDHESRRSREPRSARVHTGAARTE